MENKTTNNNNNNKKNNNNTKTKRKTILNTDGEIKAYLNQLNEGIETPSKWEDLLEDDETNLRDKLKKQQVIYFTNIDKKDDNIKNTYPAWRLLIRDRDSTIDRNNIVDNFLQKIEQHIMSKADNAILSEDDQNDDEGKEQDVKNRRQEHVDTYRKIVDTLVFKQNIPQSKIFAEMLDEVVLFGLLKMD